MLGNIYADDLSKELQVVVECGETVSIPYSTLESLNFYRAKEKIAEAITIKDLTEEEGYFEFKFKDNKDSYRWYPDHQFPADFFRSLVAALTGRNKHCFPPLSTNPIIPKSGMTVSPFGTEIIVSPVWGPAYNIKIQHIIDLLSEEYKITPLKEKDPPTEETPTWLRLYKEFADEAVSLLTEGKTCFEGVKANGSQGDQVDPHNIDPHRYKDQAGPHNSNSDPNNLNHCLHPDKDRNGENYTFNDPLFYLVKDRLGYWATAEKENFIFYEKLFPDKQQALAQLNKLKTRLPKLLSLQSKFIPMLLETDFSFEGEEV